MLLRMLLSFVILLVIGMGQLFAQGPHAPIRVGETLSVRMTGKLALQYARCVGSLKNTNRSSGLQIETIGRITQKLGGDQVRIEHSSLIDGGSERPRLVTFSATVDRSRITTEVTPQGTRVYPSPVDPEKTTVKLGVTANAMITRRMEFSTLKGVMLRSWTLAEQFGH